ncbi:MAG: hypothetical protein N4A54_04015 [Peptostreptococcaceae bacterium]|jgi:predicted CopG family antitoxin|nr:hypothetical protein [Peptostreptococcaceae bacterium]
MEDKFWKEKENSFQDVISKHITNKEVYKKLAMCETGEQFLSVIRNLDDNTQMELDLNEFNQLPSKTQTVIAYRHTATIRVKSAIES